jgi:hypothetical protein
MKILLALLLTLVSFNFTSAQSNWENFKKQSAPIKKWILLHPFKAKKAYVISLEAQKVADSISKTNVLDGDAASGQVDAFRHAYWMAHLNQKIGKCAALSLGRAYERANKKSFRKSRRKAEISSYDKPSKQMDLFNNKIGVTFSKKKIAFSKRELIFQLITSIKKGEFKILKKDALGNYVDCANNSISEVNLILWNNTKCLIDSSK